MPSTHLRLAVSRYLGPLRQRFEALQPRERLLVSLVGAVLVWALAQLLYFNAAATREKQLRQTISEARQQLVQLEVREQVLRAQLAQGSLAMVESRRAELMQKQAALDARLREQGIGLMDTNRMRQVLHDVLQGSNLNLIALHRLTPELAFATTVAEEDESAQPASKTEKQGFALYRHPLRIELEGRYPDMLRYLERLEASPWQLMWQSLDIETRDYPNARMRLTVYTLSLEEDWIGV